MEVSRVMFLHHKARFRAGHDPPYGKPLPDPGNRSKVCDTGDAAKEIEEPRSPD
jgi:hypothetical protein